MAEACCWSAASFFCAVDLRLELRQLDFGLLPVGFRLRQCHVGRLLGGRIGGGLVDCFLLETLLFGALRIGFATRRQKALKIHGVEILDRVGAGSQLHRPQCRPASACCENYRDYKACSIQPEAQGAHG